MNKNIHFIYPVDIASDEDGVTVTFPDIPEAITEADNIEDALFHAKDALETALFDIYIADDLALPQPSKPKKGQYTVMPAMQSCLKLHLYTSMRENQVSVAEVARRVDLPWGNVQRLLKRGYSAKIERYENALNKIGVSLSVQGVETRH